MADPLYRVRQFLRAARAAPLTNEELERVRSVLDDAALALYQTMPLGDQHHSLKIFDALRAQGYDAPPLLQAALLHDVAKRNLGLGYRTGVILLKKISPHALERIASENARSWRHPFYVSLHHPALGAEMAQRAGVDERAAQLIRAHQETSPQFCGNDAVLLQEWQCALKRLDDVN